MSTGRFASSLEVTEEPEGFEDDRSIKSLTEDIPVPDEFRIAFFCPLPIEIEAAGGALDTNYEVDPDEYKRAHHIQGDLNVYRLGTIKGHNIVICRPPERTAGPIVAAMGWRDLKRSFPEIKYLFIVGIGGGVPYPFDGPDIRLGDVVIGLQDKNHPGMIQLDAGHQNDKFVPLIQLNVPPKNLQALAEKLIDFPKTTRGNATRRANIFKDTAEAVLEELKWPYPGLHEDCCFRPDTSCVDKRRCPTACRTSAVPQYGRPVRSEAEQFVHGGLICSSSKVIKNANFRDQTVQENFEKGPILCFETEGYGIASDVSCLNIRGISDYADCHKTSKWQGYAAAHAAAAAKIIVILLIETFDAKETNKTLTRKSTSVLPKPASPGNKPVLRASSFGLPRKTESFRSKGRANTNPPESVLKVLRVVPEINDFSELNKGKWPATERNKSFSDTTEEIERYPPEQSPLAGAFGTSSFTNMPQARSGTNQSEPFSPSSLRLDRIDTMNRYTDPRTSIEGASLERAITFDDGSIEDRSGSSLEGPRNQSFSSRKSSHGSSQLSPLRSHSSQLHTRTEDRSVVSHSGPSPTKQESQILDRQSISPPSSVRNRIFPPHYRITGEPCVEKFIEGRICQFAVDIHNFQNSQFQSSTYERFGPFTGHFEIELRCVAPSTVPSKLLTFGYKDDSCDNVEYVQFWLPVDEIDLKADGYGFVIQWADCESLVYRMVNGISQCFREYNAQMPNLKLNISFREQEDQIYFRDKILNEELEFSSWTARKCPMEPVLDAYGQLVKVFYRADDTSFGAGTLITTHSSSSMKVHRMKKSVFTLLEMTADSQGLEYHFSITELWTIDYLAVPERRDYFDAEVPRMKNGKPDKQMYLEQTIAGKGQQAVVIKLSRDTIPRFLGLLFWWRLIFDANVEALRYKSNKKSNMMLLLYKHDAGLYWILSCNTDAKLHEKRLNEKKRVWYLFEVNPDKKKEIKKKNQTITIPISRWKETNILSHDQFHYRFEEDKLQLGIEFQSSQDVERLWPVFNNLKPK